MAQTDKIEKQVTLKVSRERVWNAISDAKQFGTWFGVRFDQDGTFVANTHLTAHMTPTQVDPEVAKMQEKYKGETFEWSVDRVEPMTHISFRWHPFALEKGYDYSKEPTTLIEFELSDAPGGTHLRITESGFDKIPAERRAKAFSANDGGWTKQLELVKKFVER